MNDLRRASKLVGTAPDHKAVERILDRARIAYHTVRQATPSTTTYEVLVTGPYGWEAVRTFTTTN